MSDVIVVGSFVQDLAFSTTEFPSPGETRIGNFTTGPGGKGFNQAVACHRLDAKTLFIGACGEDIFAQTVKNFAAAEKLAIEIETFPELSTGAASIVVNAQGENLIVVSLGASGALSKKFLDSKQDQFAKAKVVVSQLECNLEATARALELGRKAGAITVLNPAPINPECTRELLALSDVLVPNETEAAYFLGKLYGVTLKNSLLELSDAELATLCAYFPAREVIVTLGSQGAFRYTAGGKSQRYPAAAVKPIDTTGAGDSFTGALAAGLVRFDRDFDRAIRFAVCCAGLSTEQRGTAPAMPLLEAVLRRFPRQ